MANQVQIRIEQTGPATSRAVVRGHQVSVDRPLEKGGDDQGPMGGELILVGLGGCFTSNLLAAIRARQAVVTQVSTTVTATLAESPSRFAAIDLGRIRRLQRCLSSGKAGHHRRTRLYRGQYPSRRGTVDGSGRPNGADNRLVLTPRPHDRGHRLPGNDGPGMSV